MSFKLHLTFGPQWENVSNIRTFVTQMLSPKIVNYNDARKVATASSELVENVIKYSATGSAVIDIKKEPKIGHIHLTIRNISDRAHLDTFETVFEQVTQGDPKEVYKKMMLQSFNAPLNSRLGLARIRYECEGDIRYGINEDIRTISSALAINITDKSFRLLSVTVAIPVNPLARSHAE